MRIAAVLGRDRSKELTAVLPAPEGLVVASIEHGAAQVQLTQCEFIPWPDSLQREAILRESSRRLSLHKRRCATLMPVGDYSILSVEAPEVPPQEMKAAVRWRIRELIDFHIDDAVIDIFDVPVSGIPGRQNNLYTVVARQSVVRQQVDLLQAHNINLQVIDIPELALTNIATLLPGNDRGQVMLYLTADQGVIVIVKDSNLYLARTMDLGYRAFATTDDHRGAPPRSPVDSLVLEIQRTLDYYDRYFRQSPVGSLWLAPLPAGAEELAAALGDNLGMTAQVLDLNVILPQSPPLDRQLQAQALLAVGAALRRESAGL